MMDSFLNITLGTIPIGILVLVVGLLNRQKISSLCKRMDRLDGNFMNHLKYHIKKGGE